MRPEEFVAKWRSVQFGEKQASQEMFLDICVLAEHDTPVAFGNPDVFTFEKWVPGGFADAYYEEHFGWEFKGDDADLDAGLNQLLRYQVHLKTPPLLIVSSFRTIRIQTNFPGMETVRHEIPVAALEQREQLDKLRRVFHAPADFRPNRTLDAVTRDTADLFHAIVLDMERSNADLSASSGERLARYLNQIMFCLYAEDAGLLPGGLFTQIVRNHFHNPQLFDRAVRGLFQQMAGGGLFGADEVAHFNGDLFNTTETVEFSLNALYLLNQAAEKDWRNIEPSIFGTLFERASTLPSAPSLALTTPARTTSAWWWSRWSWSRCAASGRPPREKSTALYPAATKLPPARDWKPSSNGWPRSESSTRPAAAATSSTSPYAPCWTWRSWS